MEKRKKSPIFLFDKLFVIVFDTNISLNCVIHVKLDVF
jgi:hypothetical protein